MILAIVWESGPPTSYLASSILTALITFSRTPPPSPPSFIPAFELAIIAKDYPAPVQLSIGDIPV